MQKKQIIVTNLQQAGFTLPEILMAALIGSVVIGAAGFGLIAMMEADAQEQQKNLRQTELNRALDFITDEVRSSSQIFIDGTVGDFSPATGASDVQIILSLQIPEVTQPVIYYVATPATNSVWSGQKVVYRWGPFLNLDGTYSAQPNENRLLVDNVSSQTPAPNLDCPGNLPISFPANKAERKGFYSCTNDSPTSSIAEIYIHGEDVGRAKTRVTTRTN